MKKKLILLALPTVMLFHSCSECSVTKSDLIHVGTSFAMNVLTSPNPAYTTISIAGEFLNAAESIAGKCSCATGTEEAGAQDCNWKIYSSDDGINVKELLTDQNIQKSNLIACASDMSGINFDFLNGGYYVISNVLDFLNDVDERVENNNTLESGAKKPRTAKEIFEYEKNKYGNNFKYQVIYIDMDGHIYDVDQYGQKKKLN